MIVIDASVAVKWVLDEEGADSALALRDADLTAPSLWLLEAAAVLWQRARRGEFSEPYAGEMLADLRAGPIETTPLEDDLATALTMAHMLGHPVYDCLYLAAAVRLGTYVITADRRFWQAASRTALSGHVRLLGTH